MIPDRNRGRGGAARGYMLELLDLAREQGWQTRQLGNAVRFIAPTKCRRPGFESITVNDPHNDGHAQRVIRSRLEKAGMKFIDDEPEREEPTVAHQPPPSLLTAKPNPPPANPSATTQPIDRFARIEQKISAAVALLSEIEQEVSHLKTDLAKYNQLRELLKSV